MTRLAPPILAAALALAGCSATAVQTFTRPNASQATVSRAETECRVEANQLFPAANYPVTYPTGGFYGGWGPGWGWGGVVTTSDVNASMRAAHYRDCMRLKGFAPVVHPICTTTQLNGRSYRPTGTVPAPSAQYCAVPAQSGGHVIVDLTRPL